MLASIIAPALQAKAHELEREMKKDSVWIFKIIWAHLQVHAELEKRHSVEEMESKGFISWSCVSTFFIDTSVAPSLASRVKSVEKEMKKDSVLFSLI